MRARVRYIAIALLTATMTSLAAGYGMIMGITPDGWTVAFVPDSRRLYVQIWREGPERQSSVQTFENEPCEFFDDDNGRRLSCAATGKSPLAGTKYVGRPFNGVCEKAEPEYEFLCTEGCDRNPRAPRKLTQGYWEC